MTDTLPPGSIRRRRRRWWLILPSFVFALVVAELVLRWREPARPRVTTGLFGETEQGLLHTKSSVPGLLYELAPSREIDYQGVNVRTNSLGMRSPEIADPKAGGTLRIAAIGDSVTFGWGVDAEHIWPAILQRVIGERRPSEVLNFGVSGYSSRDEALVLRAKALPRAPDVIVLAYFLNDPEAGAVSPLHAWFRDDPWWKSTRLWRMWAMKQRKREVDALGGGNFYRWLHNPEGWPWQTTVAALEDIARASSDARVPVLVAIFPTWFGYADLGSYPYAEIHAQVAREVERHGMKSLDLLSAFRASGMSLEDLKMDAEHPNGNGHEVAARAIFERLEELNWLEPKR